MITAIRPLIISSTLVYFLSGSFSSSTLEWTCSLSVRSNIFHPCLSMSSSFVAGNFASSSSTVFKDASPVAFVTFGNIPLLSYTLKKVRLASSCFFAWQSYLRFLLARQLNRYIVYNQDFSQFKIVSKPFKF